MDSKTWHGWFLNVRNLPFRRSRICYSWIKKSLEWAGSQNTRLWTKKRYFAYKHWPVVVEYSREWAKLIIQIKPPMLVMVGNKTNKDGKGCEATSSGENGFWKEDLELHLRKQGGTFYIQSHLEGTAPVQEEGWRRRMFKWWPFFLKGATTRPNAGRGRKGRLQGKIQCPFSYYPAITDPNWAVFGKPSNNLDALLKRCSEGEEIEPIWWQLTAAHLQRILKLN